MGDGRGRSSCREQEEDSLWGRNPVLRLGSQETHQPFTNPQGVGGRRRESFAQRRAPLITVARNRTFSLLYAPFPKLFPATQQARCYFHYPPNKDTEAGADQAHCPRMLTDIRPISWISSLPQKLGSQRWIQGWCENRCGLKGAQLACAVSLQVSARQAGTPGFSLQLNSSSCSLQTHTVQEGSALPLPLTTTSVLEIPGKGS